MAPLTMTTIKCYTSSNLLFFWRRLFITSHFLVTQNGVFYFYRMKPIVQYVVVRRDLNWPLGALMAQACHAAVAATHLHYTHQNTRDYLADLDNMHKVVLGAKSRAHLEKLAAKLNDKEIDYKLWIEQPEDYPTCLALRPYPKEDVQKLFKEYKA